MDENSCEGETSKSTTKATNSETSDKNQNTVQQILKENRSVEVNGNNGGGPNINQISEFRETETLSKPSVSSSQPALPQFDLTNVIPLELPNVSQRETVLECPITTQPLRENAEELPQVQIVQAELQKAKRPSIGPPPSYSFVMKQKRKGSKPSSPPDFTVTERPPPPPTYNGTCVPPETETLGRICIMPSYSEPRWRSHPQPAICPRCGILVFTTTHTHDSITTHIAALALCLFGCWPCCFLPYCMSACKNTYHHCPFCQSYLGSYTPW